MSSTPFVIFSPMFRYWLVWICEVASLVAIFLATESGLNQKRRALRSSENITARSVL